MPHSVTTSPTHVIIEENPQGGSHDPRASTSEASYQPDPIPVVTEKKFLTPERKMAATWLTAAAIGSLVVKKYAGRDAAAAVFVSFGIGVVDIAASMEPLKQLDTKKVAITGLISGTSAVLAGLIYDVDLSTIVAATIPATLAKTALIIGRQTGHFN